MAQAAVMGHPHGGDPDIRLCGLPRLSKEAHQIYGAVFPERLDQFPQPLVHQTTYSRAHTTEINLEYLKQLPWSHELRHDAESAFWLLVW